MYSIESDLIYEQDFKKIVDELLCELMAELDITQEQFLEACDKAQSNSTHTKIVDQIMAVDNFMAFKKLMIKRNTELNEEALKMMLLKEQQNLQQQMQEQQPRKIQQQQKQQKPEKPTTQGNIDPDELERERAEMELVMSMSMAAEEERKKYEEEEQELIKMAMEQSIKEEQIRVERQKSIDEEQAKKLEIAKKASEKEFEEKQQQQKQEVQQVQEQVQQMNIEEEEKVQNHKGEQKKNFVGYNLPPVALRKGGMEFDPQLLKEQQEAILKGLTSMDEELTAFEQKSKKDDPFENKSMSEVLKEKRQNTEKILENTKTNQQESMEERKARLRAHRDQLLKQKNEQRQKDLEQFKYKASNKEDLFKELKEIDTKIKAKEEIQKLEDNFEFENMEGSEYDKRLAMYKNLREQMLRDLHNSKQAEQKAKMDELNKKIDQLEKAKREKMERENLQKQALEQQRAQQNRGFLEGIKSYSVEDI